MPQLPAPIAPKREGKVARDHRQLVCPFFAYYYRLGSRPKSEGFVQLVNEADVRSWARSYCASGYVVEGYGPENTLLIHVAPGCEEALAA